MKKIYPYIRYGSHRQARTTKEKNNIGAGDLWIYRNL